MDNPLVSPPPSVNPFDPAHLYIGAWMLNDPNINGPHPMPIHNHHTETK